MPFSQKQLVQKGFAPASMRAAMVGGGHKPPSQCVTSDYVQLPPQIQRKYDPMPHESGRQMVHRLR